MAAPAQAMTDETPASKDSGGAPSFDVPGLLFDNRTPFAAIEFDIVDQHDAPFHVIVGKIGYTIGPCNPDGWATLILLDPPVALNTEDRHDGDDPAASVLEESDFAPFKPRCDVIVNALAHAPKKTPAKTFSVRLTVMPGAAAASKRPIIDKALVVCGPRWFVKEPPVAGLLRWPLKIATLGLMRPDPWYLSAPEQISHLPVRYEYAFGGECRIDSSERAAKRVPAKDRIAARPAAGAQEPQAVAHEACDTNPLGRGFARGWFLKATKSTRLPAPQISAEARRCNARDFQNSVDGKNPEPPAGFGAVGRAWLPRRALIGNIEDKPNWGADEIPRLPADFDFAYWNCAPQDQQCDYLNGQEQFTLVNLCSPDSPAARPDQHGNTVLRFALPQQAMFVLAANRAAQLTVLPLSLDTVIINPESGRVDLVWRGCLPADGNNVESRLMHITEPEQLARLDMLVQHQWSEAPPNDADGK